MYPKFNLNCYYNQFNHLHAPKYFDWVTDGTGEINFWVDDYIKNQQLNVNGKADVAMLIEPRTIQPTIYSYVEAHYEDFNLIFSHDEEILKLPNAHPIFFMNWYKTYDVPKTKAISMVCSDKVMCDEHKARQLLADRLGDKVDHYGMYKGGYKCDYYECRAEYMFEVVVDNNWSGYWISEKLANPIASKTIPIYLGGKHFPQMLDLNGIIRVENIDELEKVVDKILLDPEGEYKSRLKHVDINYMLSKDYQVFEDWFYKQYKDLLRQYCNISIISNNCMGGCMLHDLKIPYQSPTVSLQILPEEYPKFCKYITDYMAVEIVECKKEDLSEKHKGYLMNMFGKIPDMPYGLCDDILICFQHYPTFEDGYNMWERRRKRFDPHNVAYIFYVRDKMYLDSMNEFIDLNLNNSLIFMENFNMDIPVEHYNIVPPEGGHFLDYRPDGHRHYEYWFNPAKWVKKVRKG